LLVISAHKLSNYGTYSLQFLVKKPPYYVKALEEHRSGSPRIGVERTELQWTLLSANLDLDL